MYIPATNEWDDQERILAFMQRFSFATITHVNQSGLPVATHLPFVVQQDEQGIRLLAHFARANEQWKHLESQVALVVFAEPHAYVSPSHYDKKLSVPTWNYQSVHAYGTAKLLTEEAAARTTLEALIVQSEPEYLAQWQSLPAAYQEAMLKGIVAFEVLVTDLQAKSKLSQNKPEVEQMRIAQTYSQCDDPGVNYLADEMQRQIQSKKE